MVSLGLVHHGGPANLAAHGHISLGKHREPIIVMAHGEDAEVAQNRGRKETFDNTALVSFQSGTMYMCDGTLLPQEDK